MEIGTRESFLVVSAAEPTGYPAQHSIAIFTSLDTVLHQWKPATRLSPIFGIRRFGTAIPRPDEFKGASTIVFLGPTHPARLLDLEKCIDKAWVTLGSFNILIRLKSARHRSSVVKYCCREHIPFEIWALRNGWVKDVTCSPRYGGSNEWQREIAESTPENVAAVFGEALNEYGPLMASSMSRCEKVIPGLFDDLRLANRLTLEMIKSSNSDADNYDQLSALITMNASLSRFSSQAFSGTSPIFETECHFWIHSLLGIGTANIALHRIRDFVTRTIGKYHIPIRVEKYSELTYSGTSILDDPDARNVDYLDKVTLTAAEQSDPLFPLITYWSGRDNFKSGVNSLSAPLACLFSCSSLSWSLATLTHELTHSIIRGVLGVISFDLDDPDEAALPAKLYEAREALPNVLLDMRRAFICCVMQLEEADLLAAEVESQGEFDVREILRHWRTEVEELLVHVFDFLYFYGGDWERYVPGIWLSWCAVPNLGDRIREYVLRTLTALMARNMDLSGDEAANAARIDMLHLLKMQLPQMKKRNATTEYIVKAIALLEGDWDTLNMLAIARYDIARLVRAFLYSETLGSTMQRELGLDVSRRKREGYKFKVRGISAIPLRSPLKFIEAYTTNKRPSLPDSIWMLMTIAYNTSHE